MKTRKLRESFPLALLEWIARVGSILSVGLLVTLFVGEGFHPGSIAPKEMVGLVFFPLGVMVGMILAWWREELGAVVAIASLGGFYLVYGFMLESHIGGWWFVIFTLPGFLFLLHALAARVSSPTNPASAH